ncbi:MAG TPA: hypothetical protein VFE18_13065 [Phenylobacterium sp.]|jgi:hypothetical protein|uniref:hypothetical protein n=1 Tax=Phenylobacterium sp. TaxID=1871053 RepID=UPI002D2B28CF|nr:hypothetical protein [Phenylobacterium sp.]
MGLLWGALALSPAVAHAQPADLFYERAVMSAADQRCGLFAPDVAAALAAATAQARGAALRAGTLDDVLRRTERTAQAKAAAIDCRSPDVATAAARVKSAFSGFAKLTRLTYTGDIAGWQADRNLSRNPRWQLSQETSFGPDRMAFGLAGRDGREALVAVAHFAGGEEPYGARLVLRDQSRSSQPYLDRFSVGSTAGLPLARRLPPALAQKAYNAAARASAGVELLPKGATSGWAFRFPDEASQDLAKLDPREAVAVDFLFPGDVTRRAYVEVGDFAAGRAFLQVSGR